MNTTRKKLASLLAIVIVFGFVSAGLTQLHAGPPQNLAQGICNQMIDCFRLDPDVQTAVEGATHERYIDAEAVAAMGAEDEENSLNHLRYTDADAVDAVGPAGITGYAIVTTVVPAQPTGFGAELLGTCPCPAGRKVLGGGGRLIQTATQLPADSGLRPIVRSIPSGDTGWQVMWIDSGFTPDTLDLHIFAICANIVP